MFTDYRRLSEHFVSTNQLKGRMVMKRLLFLLIHLIFTFSVYAQNQIKTTTANLNLRSSPTVGENIIQVIPKGTTFSVDNAKLRDDGWIHLDYKGNSGYVHSRYLKSPPAKSNPAEFSNPTKLKHYTNSSGEKVQSPTYYDSPPSGATAECRDGTYSFSRSRRGTCSHHGGVKRWF